MATFDRENYLLTVGTMSNEELERELNNVIQFEGDNDPRVDELVFEVLKRELMISDDILLGTELDELEPPADVKPREEV